jgi:PKD repeat protein
LTLSTPAQAISADGTAIITAELRGNTGQPLVGATIAFTTTIGTIDPKEAVTNGAGQATAVFSAGSATGTAVIGASSGSVRATAVNVVVGAAAVGRVALTASPTAVPSGGGSSTVTAVVTDATGNPLSAMPVEFRTSAGTLTPANVKTDANGMVQTTLTTSATALVTAIAGLAPGTPASSTTASITGTVTVTLAPRPVPVVSIAASADAVAGSPVTFTIGATPAPGSNTTIRSVSVNFGDGTQAELGAASGTAIVAQHLYAVGGTYTVSMTATDSAGATATASTVLVVRATAPLAISVVAGAMVPAGGGPNAIVTFAVTVIPATAVITRYLWDFGDGSAPQQTTTNQVQHVFALPGLYTVNVTATEALTGATAIGSVPVSTASGMPTVSIVAGPDPVAGRSTTFTIAAAIAPGSSVTMRSVRVTFGDGTAPVDLGGVTGGAISVGHVYASAGTYLVSVTATDSGTGTATASTQVVVASAGVPTVSITPGASAVAGSPTTFTVTASPAAGGNATIRSVQVTFGDGTAAVDLGAVSGSATTQHVYASAGTFSVSATATDSNGATATASTQVSVAAPGAPSVSLTPSASVVAGSPATFTINAAPAAGSSATIQNVRVTFGDGTAPVDLGAVSGAATTQHVYSAAGNYTASATATASNGATATASTQVAVAAPGAPSVSLTASANPIAGSTTTFTITATPPPGTTATIQNVSVSFAAGVPPVNLGAVSGSTTTQHVYAAAGTYTATAVATASNGATATASTQVVVAARPAPSVSISAGENPVIGRVTTFTVTATPAATGGATIQNVRVTFGDNSAPTDLGAISAATTTQHSYGVAGTYTASATATDTAGATATANTTVVVSAPATISLTVSAAPTAGTPTQFTVTVLPSLGVTIQGATLNYGDGVLEQLGVVSGTPAVRTHTYANGGTFTATATASIQGGTIPVSTQTTFVVSGCAVYTQEFFVFSQSSSGLHAWPGGEQTFSPTSGCSVTVVAPTGTISNLSGDAWRIVNAVGRTMCTITPRIPACGGVGSSAGLLSNGRPYCSNAAATIFDNPSASAVDVECR